MRILAVADLHGHLPPVPECDLLLVAGDVCPLTDYSPDDQLAWLNGYFRDWLERRSCKIILVAGNHDFVFQRNPRGVAELQLPCEYLEDSGTQFEGISIYGLPWVPELGSWAFFAEDRDIADRYAAIPAGTDIIVSHGPPFGYGDRVGMRNVGCAEANRAIERIRPKAFVNGHVHEGCGIYRFLCEDESTVDVYNAAFVDENYRIRFGKRRFLEVQRGSDPRFVSFASNQRG